MEASSSVNAISPIVGSLDLLLIVRLIFYMMVALKLFEVVYLRKRKMNLKERIYRKFLFAHNQVIRTFTEDERMAMENTLNNTLKNANISFPKMDPRKSKTSKKVCFFTENNSYHEPRRDEEPRASALDPEMRDSDFVNNQEQEAVGLVQNATEQIM